MPHDDHQQNLKDRLVHLQALFETIPDLVWVKDVNGVFLECNLKFLEFFNFKREDIIGKTDYDFFDKSLADFFKERDRIAMVSTEPVRNEEVLINGKTQKSFTFETTKAPMKSADGSIVGVLGIARDVSVRKDYERILKKKLDLLTQPTDHHEDLELEEIFEISDLQALQNQFSDSMRVASVITAPDGTPITAPSNFTRFCFGVVRGTEKGLKACMQSDAEIGCFHGNHSHVQPCLSGGLWDAGVPIIVGGKHIANWLIGQVRNETQTEFNILLYAKKIGADPEEALKAFREVPVMSREQFQKTADMLYTLVSYITTVAYQNLMQARFISERKEHELKILAVNEELKAATEALSERNSELILAAHRAEESEQLKSAFLANMSHEIRTPLNAILGFASFLGDPDLNREDVSHYVEIITQSGENLLELINNVIDISKIDAGIVTLNRETIDVKLLMRQIYSIQYSRLVALQKGDLDLHLSMPAGEIVTQDDKLRLRQIIDNLIQNALKFTESGSVELGLKKQDSELLFWVKDTGIGIERNDFRRIFERFQQAAKSSDKLYGGTGLGLSIAKSCVELLEGKIWLESERGKGSTFYFTIPYHPVVSDQKTVHEILSSRAFNGEHVLIAEDDPVNFEYLKTILKKQNLKITHAKNGCETLEFFEKNPDVRLILMDIQMPEMDGLEATRRIREKNATLPIIAQTAYAFSGDQERCIKAGCNGYLSKPTKSSELIQVLKSYLCN